MRAANERTVPELDLAITRFLEDFQNIIREHVQRALQKRHGSRKPGKRAATKRRAVRRPEQLSLF